MNEIVAILAKKLGLPESTIESGLAVLLKLLKEKSGGGEFQNLIGLVPGLADLSEKAAAPTASGGAGVLGGVMGMAGGILGGQAGDAAKAFAGFQQAGIPADKIVPFVRGFFEQVRDSGGSDFVSRISAAIPALRSVIGEIPPSS